MNYKTPGVYVEEISIFPPSVAAVATAVPAFIGYTEKAFDKSGKEVSTFPYIQRITSLLEYEQLFGKTLPEPVKIQIDDSGPAGIQVTPENFLEYYAMRFYFANGGGPCYVVSVGIQEKNAEIDFNDLLNGLNALKKKDEPTLILFPSAVKLAAESDYYEVLKQALGQCQNLGDRFTIMNLYNDVHPPSNQYDNFRQGIGANNLKYGAAYTPWLKTTIPYHYHDGSVTFEDPSGTIIINGKVLVDLKAILQIEDILVDFTKAIGDVNNPNADDASATAGIVKAALLALSAVQVVIEAEKLSPNYGSGSGAEIAAALAAANTALSNAEAATDVASAQGLTGEVQDVIDEAKRLVLEAAGLTNSGDVDALENYFTDAFENNVRQLINQQRLTLPPGSAIAGVYATVDRTRGVWKTPANISLNQVDEPVVKISAEDQKALNVHDTGKSINAIRAFTGKGILVWGGRTLAGNDNEWRYISVRRFFNMAEESVKKATERFIFEPNDAKTWVKVRVMIENFLSLQWRAGALVGAKPEDAFFVKIGLGETMTAQDILEGFMKVEIGMAVSRPAEFIILKFAHKMQSA